MYNEKLKDVRMVILYGIGLVIYKEKLKDIRMVILYGKMSTTKQKSDVEVLIHRLLIQFGQLMRYQQTIS